MKGPTPCLIGATLGSCSFGLTGSRGPLAHCKRCRSELGRQAPSVEVSIPGSFGSKTFCLVCFEKILDATQTKLNSLRLELVERSQSNNAS
jgi:hypothetical protein